MKDKFVCTIYEGDNYIIPYEEMEEWFEYIKALSLCRKDSGHLDIAFSDKFSKYKI